VNSDLPKAFARLLFQLCHIVLGLRPQSRSEEGEIVRGWLEREEKMPLVPGSMWYIISMDWWTQWHAYVNDGSGESFGFNPVNF
jgi:ubiquitin carboxyl-terminal hydrolase 6/32